MPEPAFLDSATLAALVSVAVLFAGVMRGITGFGGAMLMAPPMGLLLGAIPAIVIALFLEAAAALLMIPSSWRDLDGALLLRLLIPALLTIPLGTLLLVGLDPVVARRAIGAMVIVSSLAMMTGVRFPREPTKAVSIGVGLLAGVLIGAIGIGAPPVIVLLLSSPLLASTTRAVLTVYISATSLAALASLAFNGVVTWAVILQALALAAIYLIGIKVGSHVFAQLSERGARSTALMLMLVLGLLAMVVT